MSQTSKIGHLRRLVAIMTGVVSMAFLLLTYLQVEWDKREALRNNVDDMQNLSTALTRQAESTIRDAHTVLIGIERKLKIAGYGPENLQEGPGGITGPTGGAARCSRVHRGRPGWSGADHHDSRPQYDL
ncbi:hypothetical protein K5Q02_00595 [Pseudomonas sp. MM211]|uniref:hypothetical protein n=1 Tax=Pseudomonas sp. MM211 TaxID=2866808 RepID=UPI001CEC73DC|nr:hypothetical protein [Pseudomonas sp. MM211]UCJ16937.1 hypothetical protein K5Q02_00595 [Pseudomonas sp. MM211]